MSATNDPEKWIEDYLRRVSGKLRGLSQQEVGEILEELRGHIRERALETGTLTVGSVQAALESLGKPETLARMYRTEGLAVRAIASRSPWLAFRAVLLWAFLSVGGLVVFTVAVTGYGMGIDFILSAVLKPLFPRNMGIWWGGHPFVFEMGAHWPAPPGAKELTGWWVSPLLLAVGIGFLFITHRFTLACIRRFRRLRAAHA